MSNYLRNRPFMLINYTFVLAAGQKSQAKGFGETAEWEPVENMKIVDRVSTKQMNEAYLVLDLFENKVLKCREDDVDLNKVFDLMVQRHYEDVKVALATWIKKDPTNLLKVQSFVERFSTKDGEVEATEESNNAE